MATVIDSSLWVDFFRARTPLAIKERVAFVVEQRDAALCDPIRFEILRAARRDERDRVETTFATFPLLSTPSDLWEKAVGLGQKCVDAGIRPRSLDLLIATVCLRHDSELVTFDADFAEMAKVCPLNVRLLTRHT